MIEVLQAFRDGKEILGSTDSDMWYTIGDKEHLFNFKNNLYRIKPEPTRAEITKKWIEDNGIKVGSKVKVVKKVCTGEYGSDINWVDEMDDYLGKVCMVDFFCIDSLKYSGITLDVGYLFPVESLEPYKEEWIPFTFEDRDMFRGKWIKHKVHPDEFKTISIDRDGVIFGNGRISSYRHLFETHEFIDGTPFGKKL